MRSEEADSRIFDVPNPNITLPAIELALSDLIPSSIGFTKKTQQDIDYPATVPALLYPFHYCKLQFSLLLDTPDSGYIPDDNSFFK